MTEVGQETVDFAALVGRAAEESFVAMKELVEKSKSSESLSDSEKKIMILKYIVKTQQRMLRLDVLAKWCQQVFLFINFVLFFCFRFCMDMHRNVVTEDLVCLLSLGSWWICPVGMLRHLGYIGFN